MLHPATVLTSIVYIEEFMKSHGQRYVHLVADLQLFKVSIQIKWCDPTRWKYLVVRPGGMHTLMSFLGCVDNLMKGSGLEEILNVVYEGMLNGKVWPKAMRTLPVAALSSAIRLQVPAQRVCPARSRYRSGPRSQSQFRR